MDQVVSEEDVIKKNQMKIDCFNQIRGIVIAMYREIKQQLQEDQKEKGEKAEKTSDNGKQEVEAQEEGKEDNFNYETFDPLAMLEEDEDFLSKVDPLHF